MRCKNCGWPNKPGATVCCKCKSPLDYEETQLGDSVDEDSQSSAAGLASGNANVDSEAATVLNNIVSGVGNAGAVEDSGLSKTVLESPVNSPEQPVLPQENQEESPATRPEFRFPDECPQCHYPLRPNTQRCPNCQAVIWPIGSPNNEPIIPPVPQPKPNVESTMYGAPVDIVKPTPLNSTVINSPHDVQKPDEPLSSTVNPWLQAKPKAQFRLELIPGQGEVLREREHSFETEEGQEVKLNRSNTESSNNTITSKTQAVVKFDGEHWTIEDHSALQTTYVRAGRPMELHDGDIILLGDRQFVFHEIDSKH